MVADVYHTFKRFGSGPIELEGEFDPTELAEQARKILDEVHSVYGQFSAWRLREMTHGEGPWKDFFRDGISHIEIPHSALRQYFETIVAR